LAGILARRDAFLEQALALGSSSSPLGHNSPHREPHARRS
jgi:hypothetical protein